jgi:RNA polymerase sigma factor (sigma-70 family)
MTSDCELLRRYAETGAEEAFAELARRHVDLVYSAALRQVNGQAALAQEVAQNVFTDLARKAGALADRQSLTGWLYTGARFAAIKAVRSERRRSAREQEAQAMRDLHNNPEPQPDWSALAPLLDDAMHQLRESDREAILLRYFEKRPLAEVGAKLGLSENTARMRVERALDKLRGLLASRGTTSAAALASVLSANAVQIAPAGLAATFAGASVAAAGAASASTVINIIAMTKLQIAFSALVLAGGATAFFAQHQSLVQQRKENQALQEKVTGMESDVARLSTPAPRVSNSLSNDQFTELLRLRGEVAVLRHQTNAPVKLQQQRQFQVSAEQFQMVMEFEARKAVTINALKQIGVAMRVWAGDNDNKFATNFEAVYNELGGTNKLGGIDVDEFEFMNVGLLKDDLPDKIAFRERVPRRAPDGKWERAYGLVDGSVQSITSADGNFDEWEKTGMVSTNGQ